MLSGESLAAFKEQDWHQHAKVFPAAIDNHKYAISAEEILELASYDFVESRVIQRDYSVKFGPFEEYSLPDASMLMVQCMECHSDIAMALLQTEFTFLPLWQVDDVMVSLGQSGASCGPHFDRYDVFLLQVSGSKTWQLDAGAHQEHQLQQDSELRLLKSFEPSCSVQCEPGDVLYVPPGVGHHGICQGQSITLSIGVRNPTVSELLAEITEFAWLESDPTMVDDQLRLPGSATNSERFTPLINEVITPALVDLWYGCYVTRLRNPEVLDVYSSSIVPSDISVGEGIFVAHRATRLAWSKAEHFALLFVNGEYFRFDENDVCWIKTFCDERSCARQTGHRKQNELLDSLVRNSAGCFV